MCDKAVWSSGFPCRGDNYPDTMQGKYLPGDEPGFRCGSKYGEFCSPENCPEGEDFWNENCPDEH